MSVQFFCKNRDRWKLVADASTVNGIDYLEVKPEDQSMLFVHFLHPLPGQVGGIPANPALSANNVFIDGGVRVKSIKVLKAVSAGKILTVTTDNFGDFSTYTLKIGFSLTNKDTPPTGFDQQLSEIDFSFKINCPNEFDCKTDNICPPDQLEEPDINYLAKDYSSFKRLLLDRLSTVMPDWKERNAADLQVALVEMMAYVGDQLSYYQDAVATEAYLQTSRRRVSLKRHARLLDYYMHDGCNSRVWVQIQISAAAQNQKLDTGTVLLTNGTGVPTIKKSSLTEFVDTRDTVVFETLYPLTVNTYHNQIDFYTWSDGNCCLPKGATRATLRDPDAGLTLIAGDVLVFEEIVGSTGVAADADKAHRYAVRLKLAKKDVDVLTGEKVMNIEWYDSDALPTTLCLTRTDNDGDEVKVSVARGNIVLADNGRTIKNEALDPFAQDDKEAYRPELSVPDNTVVVPYDAPAARLGSAALDTVQDPHQALPKVSLIDGTDIWTASKDLLGSDRFAKEFVVEMEQDGRSFLRFGNGRSGKLPLSGFSPVATYRIGNGKAGNIGPQSINTIVWDTAGIESVNNPLPASGGINAETMEEVRQFAPRAFRTQERAVTAVDYVTKTELNQEVQRAAAKFYWTGSWYTVFIIIDRKGGLPIDNAFKDTIRRHLEQYRMAGYDLEIRGPVFVPLQVSINVCAKEGYFKSDVKKSLLQAFSSIDLPDGTRGFFHPDNFTFGQPVYLSKIYELAMKVAGVGSIEITKFSRWAKNPANEREDGLLQPAELEIVRLDNDPNLPENGKIEFTMLSGL